jgi:hypothetical protein
MPRVGVELRRSGTDMRVWPHRMGLLESAVSSNNYMPGHFGKPQMALQRGASLGPVVSFKPKRTRPALAAAQLLASPSLPPA